VFGIDFPEIVFILMLIVIFFAANRLPEMGKSISEAIRDYYRQRRAGAPASAQKQKENTGKKKEAA